ncbi:protein FAR1-RELATED SEQUENCE 1 isoform X1 [Sesbania bispinosa]|nr:protein FAR1-RELATED SEQUENCE 1 isoform X1 [Sesbania bispinosa]
MIVLQICGVHNIPSRAKRYNSLCQRAFDLGDEGSYHKRVYIIAVNALEEALRKCESLKDSIQSNIEPNPSNFGSQEVNTSNNACHANKRNGTFKKRQVHPKPKTISIGVNSSCQQMGNPNIQAAGLDCSYESQQSIQEMVWCRFCHFPSHLSLMNLEIWDLFANSVTGSAELKSSEPGGCQLNSIAAIHNDYNSNKHGVQGLGQLSSTAPIHDVNYMAPQGWTNLMEEDPHSCMDGGKHRTIKFEAQISVVRL